MKRQIIGLFFVIIVIVVIVVEFVVRLIHTECHVRQH